VASIRTTLATAGTLAALGGLTAIALGAGDARPEAEPVGSQGPAEEVRTEVVTRTIRVDADRGSAATAAVVPSSSPSGADDGHRGRGRDDRGIDDHRHGRGGGDDDSDRRGRGRGRGGDDHGRGGEDHGRGRGGDDDGFDDHGRGRGGDDDGFDDHGGGDGRGRGGDDH
jgi:hypothetical protein